MQPDRLYKFLKEVLRQVNKLFTFNCQEEKVKILDRY